MNGKILYNSVHTVDSSDFIRIYTVCQSVCFMWKHDSIEKPFSFNLQIITAIFSGVSIFHMYKITK